MGGDARCRPASDGRVRRTGGGLLAWLDLLRVREDERVWEMKRVSD